MRVFVGVDKRQPIAYTVCRSSIERHASAPVQIEPIRLQWTPINRRGLTDFTFARYAAPFLCGYEGVSIFMDADVVVLGDIHELAAVAHRECPVSVVKGKLRFEWPSVMVFQNDLCKALTPEYINDITSNPQNLDWGNPVGELPPEWNFCVGYDEPAGLPKLLHYTQGIPCFPETKDCDFAQEWVEEHVYANATAPWAQIMGKSVHAEHVLKRLAKAQESQR